MAGPPTFKPLNYASVAANGHAAHRRALGTLTIYHSCDPPGTQLLHHYKKGKYTPFNGHDADYPTETVHIPRRYGQKEAVLRCGRSASCLECTLTEYESADLSLEVAKAHGIHGAYIRPTPTAKSVQEKLKDGEERGRWMHANPTPWELRDQTQRRPSFHPQAARMGSVLIWLGKVPREAEICSSAPLPARHPEASAANTPRLHVPGLGRGVDLGVGAEWFSQKIETRPEPESKVRLVQHKIPQPRASLMVPPRHSGRNHGYSGEDMRHPRPVGTPELLQSSAQPQVASLSMNAPKPARQSISAMGQSMRGEVDSGWASQTVHTTPRESGNIYPAVTHATTFDATPALRFSPYPDVHGQYHGGNTGTQPRHDHGMLFPAVVPRLSEKRVLEEAGMAAQARRKRVKHRAEDLF